MPVIHCCSAVRLCQSVQGYGARRTLGLCERYPRSTRLPRSSGNNLLRPIRIEHEISPLAVAIGNWRFTGRGGVDLKLHLKRCATCGYTNQTNLVTVPVKIQLPSGSKSLQLKDPAKKPPKGGFFVSEQETTRRKKESQEDPFLFT